MLGHSETIFSCKISPANSNEFATASYDGTIKIWDLNSLTLLKTLYGSGDFVYCVDWSKTSLLIGGSTYSGLIVLWNPSTGRELLRMNHHTKGAYFLAFHQQDENILLTTSADHSAVIIELNLAALFDSEISNISLGSQTPGKKQQQASQAAANPVRLESYALIKYKFMHPGPVFGCAWNGPEFPNVFVTCCQDGIVRLFNFRSKALVSCVLTGHLGRAFSCCWSPLVKGLLATGGDDHTIILWDIDFKKVAGSGGVDEVTTVTGGGSGSGAGGGEITPTPANYSKTLAVSPYKKLVGHKSFVRALSFNYENKNLLFSGSWDFSIRVWDISTGSCLLEINDHVADVYSLVSHPSAPFTYLSCSRDTTVRIWELDSIFRIIRYYSVWYNNFNRVILDENSSLYSSKVNTIDDNKLMTMNETNDGSKEVEEGNNNHSKERESFEKEKESPQRSRSFHKSLLSLEETMHAFAISPIISFTSKIALSLQGKTSLLLNRDLYENSTYLDEFRTLVNTTSGRDEQSQDKAGPGGRGMERKESKESSSTFYEDSSKNNEMKSPDKKTATGSNKSKAQSKIGGTSGKKLKSPNAFLSKEYMLLLAFNYYKIFSFFNSSNGSMDLLEVLLQLIDRQFSSTTSMSDSLPPKSKGTSSANTPITPGGGLPTFQSMLPAKLLIQLSDVNSLLRPVDKRKAFYENEIIQFTKSENMKILSKKDSINLNNLSQREELTELLSYNYLKTHDYMKSISLLIENNQWELAISLAPMISLEYWRKVSYQYGEYLLKTLNSEKCIYYFLSTGAYDMAIRYYLKNNDFSSAKLIAEMTNDSQQPFPAVYLAGLKEKEKELNINLNSISVSRSRPPSSSSLLNNRESLDFYNYSTPVGGGGAKEIPSEAFLQAQEKKRKQLKTVVSRSYVQQYLNQGQSILACTELLANNDPHATIDLLLKCQEIDLAYILANVLQLQVWKEKILLIWSNQCATYNEMDFAVNLLFSFNNNNNNSPQQQMVRTELEITLLLSKHCNESRMRKYLSINSLKNIDSYINAAKEEETMGNDITAILYYILCRQYSKAIQLSMNHLKKFVREPWELLLATTMPSNATTSGPIHVSTLERGFSSPMRSPMGTRPNSASSMTMNFPTALLGAERGGGGVGGDYDSSILDQSEHGERDTSAFDEESTDGFLPHHLQLIQILKYIRLKEISDENVRTSFLSYLLWYTAHESVVKGLFHNASYVLNVLLTVSDSLHFSLTKEEIVIQQFFFLLLTKDCELIIKHIKTHFLPMSSSASAQSSKSFLTENPAIKDSIFKIICLLFGTVDPAHAVFNDSDYNSGSNNQKRSKGWNHWMNYTSGEILQNEGQEMVYNIIRYVFSFFRFLLAYVLFFLHREIKSLSLTLSLPSIFSLNQNRSKSSSSSSSKPYHFLQYHNALSAFVSPSHTSSSLLSDYEFLQQLISVPEPAALVKNTIYFNDVLFIFY
jgi:WD40 repeat protein